MTCDNCKSETHKLICGKDGIRCPSCYQAEASSREAWMFRSAGNKWAPKMTHADRMHITTRHIGPEGRVISHPKWETKDY